MNKKQKLNEIGLIKLCSVLRPRQRRILKKQVSLFVTNYTTSTLASANSN